MNDYTKYKKRTIEELLDLGFKKVEHASIGRTDKYGNILQLVRWMVAYIKPKEIQNGLLTNYYVVEFEVKPLEEVHKELDLL